MASLSLVSVAALPSNNIMAKQLPLPNDIFLHMLREEKIDVLTKEGRRAARLMVNKTCNTKWTSSELLVGEETVLVFRTANRMQSREYYISK